MQEMTKALTMGGQMRMSLKKRATQAAELLLSLN
jgi:hypothetical protein